MDVGSLFSGIGGLDLGLERAGMKVKWQVEIDEYCNKALAEYWPNVARHRDVREVGTHNLEPVDLVCGGFPCQDISFAGLGAGLSGARSGLWHEYARIIHDLRPRYIVVENVAALLARGISAVLGFLASLGYDAEWEVLSASSFGAPHRRDRLFLVAYTNEIYGQAGMGHQPEGARKIFKESPAKRDDVWLQAPTCLDRVDDGVPSRLYALAVGALGNAVVPQVAEYIGRMIMAADIACAPCTREGDDGRY